MKTKKQKCIDYHIQNRFDKISILKEVEHAARMCKNSLDKETNELNEKFIRNMLDRKEFAPFAFGTVRLKILKSDRKINVDIYDLTNIDDSSIDSTYTGAIIDFLKENKWTKTNYLDGIYYITTNARVLFEWNVILGWENKTLWEFMNDYFDTDSANNYLYKTRETFVVQTNIGCTRELNRHASVLSICERSTRFVKADTVIEDFKINEWEQEEKDIYFDAINTCLNAYTSLVEIHKKPKQEARGLLPLSVLSIVSYCAYEDDWNNVFRKRTANGVHYQMKELINLMQKERKDYACN